MEVELLISLARKVEVGLYSLAPFFSEPPVRPGLAPGFSANELLDRVRDTLHQLS
jgi:GntR family transcriptional regulator/MocR family aminotransferase